MKLLTLITTLALSTAAVAQPFEIVPKDGAALPNERGATAYYRVTNLSLGAVHDAYLMYLPPHVVQVSDDVSTCSEVMSFAPHGQPGDTCILGLNILGAVDPGDADPKHHLTLCRTDGECSGTDYPLAVG